MGINSMIDIIIKVIINMTSTILIKITINKCCNPQNAATAASMGLLRLEIEGTGSGYEGWE